MGSSVFIAKNLDTTPARAKQNHTIWRTEFSSPTQFEAAEAAVGAEEIHTVPDGKIQTDFQETQPKIGDSQTGQQAQLHQWWILANTAEN